MPASEKKIVRDIEASLDFGTFVNWRTTSSFFRELRLVKENIDLIRENGDIAAAIRLYEIFLAGVLEKANEVDDSCGEMSGFIQYLMSEIVASNQEADTSASDIAKKIIGWFDNDDYGFTSYLEKEIVRVGSDTTIDAWRQALETRSIKCLPKARPELDRFKFREKIGSKSFNDLDLLKTIYIKQNDLCAYEKIANAFGVDAEDCEKIATVHAENGAHEMALEWVERGMEISKDSRYGTAFELPKLKRKILQQLGRGNDAFKDAWKAFEANPSVYTYKEVEEFVADDQRSEWYEKAKAIILKCDDRLGSPMEFLLKHNELEPLAQFVEKADDAKLESMFFSTLKKTARALEKTAPLAAAKLYKAEAMDILSRAKSKAYKYALEDFEIMKRLYEENGAPEQWQKVVAICRANHKRKYSFIGEFEEIVAGKKAKQKPSFLDRIGKHLPDDFEN